MTFFINNKQSMDATPRGVIVDVLLCMEEADRIG